MVKTAIFISGRGSNLLSLIKFSKKKNSLINICLIVSNKKNAAGLNYAKKFKIPILVTSFVNKNFSEMKILKKIDFLKIDLICLAGFMKILSHKFIKNFRKPILNIHPSLLPKYKGLNTHKRVIKNKEKFTGATVHMVSKKLDSGKIILQKKIRVYKKDSAESLRKRILKDEHRLYPKAILKIFSP